MIGPICQRAASREMGPEEADTPLAAKAIPPSKRPRRSSMLPPVGSSLILVARFGIWHLDLSRYCAIQLQTKDHRPRGSDVPALVERKPVRGELRSGPSCACTPREIRE